MSHLEWHNHAFIDENNKVIGVAVFQESDHDTELLETIRESFGAKQTVCCCTFGMAAVGYTWTGTEFQSPSYNKGWIWDSPTKTWKPPTPMPEDGTLYRWDNDTETWVETVFETRQ
jgi:hypothetical protein